MADTVKVAPETTKKVEVDERLDNGPIEDRHCTDIFCCLLFIAGVGALLYIALQGWKNGNPQKLTAVYEASGSSCKVDLPDYPYLYFPDPHPDWLNKTTCVKECPIVMNYSEPLPTVDCHPNQLVANCQAQCSPMKFDQKGMTDFSLTIDWSIMFCVYNTTKVLNRMCWPSPEVILNLGKQLLDKLNTKVNTDVLAQWFYDLSNGWNIIAASVGIALFLGLVYMIFLRFFSGVIVWGCIVLYFACLIFLGYLCYQKSMDLQKKMQDINDPAYSTGDAGSESKQNQQTYLYTAYTIWGVAAICLLGLICMFSKIRLAIAIIKTATLYIRDVFLVMLVPPVFSIIVAGWWVFWIIAAIYVYSIGEITKSVNTPFATVTHEKQTTYFIWYFIFGGLWVNAFIQAVSQFILASTACIWYFSQGDDGELHRPISRSIYRAFRYHLGSLAFGAFILAVVQFIRLVLEYINQQMEKAGANNNKCLKYLVNCLRCCMACFERFIKFLNRNAYIQIALTGSNFCIAAKEAMRIIWANPQRMTLVNGIGGAFIWIGKLFITAATVIICYEIYINVEPYKTTVTSPFLPCIVILFISYGIAVNFMSVYGMAIDSILMCFLYDEELAKGRAIKIPKHCPELLQEFFDSNEKK